MKYNAGYNAEGFIQRVGQIMDVPVQWMACSSSDPWMHNTSISEWVNGLDLALKWRSIYVMWRRSPLAHPARSLVLILIHITSFSYFSITSPYAWANTRKKHDIHSKDICSKSHNPKRSRSIAQRCTTPRLTTEISLPFSIIREPHSTVTDLWLRGWIDKRVYCSTHHVHMYSVLRGPRTYRADQFTGSILMK